MGKSFERGPRRPPRPESSEPLASRPFKAGLKGFRPAGPSCLKCEGPIDSRPGMSLSNPRGTRKVQRHGFLHPDCELEAAVETAKAQGLVKEGKDGALQIQKGVRISVPVLDEEEIEEVLKSKGARQ